MVIEDLVSNKLASYTKYRSTVKKCKSCKELVTGKQIPAYMHVEDCTVLMVGLAPDLEDHKGTKYLPFTGAIGSVLKKAMTDAEIYGDNHFGYTTIRKCNVVKGSMNRRVQTECMKYYEQEIQLLKPRLIVCLGEPVTKLLVPEFHSTFTSGVHVNYYALEGRTYTQFDRTYLFTMDPKELIKNNNVLNNGDYLGFVTAMRRAREWM